MKTTSLIFILLISFISCEYSGVKAAIDSNIFKVLTKIDFNSLFKDKVLIDHVETSGQYLFKYEVVVDNFSLTNLTAPQEVKIETGTNDLGLPVVKLSIYSVTADILIDYLYIKYGLVHDTSRGVTGDIVFSSISGSYYFGNDGKVVISDFDVEIESLTIDIKQDFLNWLIKVFKSLIKSQVQKKLNTLGDTLESTLNNWVDNEFLYDLGYGIGFNLTNIEKPHMTLVDKQNVNSFLKLFASILFGANNTVFETQSALLQFGIKGSVYPNSHPELVPDLDPPVDMSFNTDYFTNELQVLLSTYTLNTLLYMGQSSGYLHKEFTNSSHWNFPWNFDTVGLQEIIPEFAQKYPDENYEVQLKAYVSVFNHLQPLIESTETGAKIVLNFNLDFLTTVSDDPFDDPEEDLLVNVTAELPFTISVKYDLLTVNWEAFKVTKLVKNKDQLGVDEDKLVETVQTVWDSYVTKFIKGYTKNVAVASLLTIITKTNWKNLKLETKDGYLLASIAVDLDF